MATSADVNAFKARFMELASATDPQIAGALDMTDVILGDGRNWPSSRDFALARLMYAAHTVTMQMMQVANASDGSGMADLYVSSIKFGERHISFGRRTPSGANEGVGAGEAMLQTTTQGLLFLELRARNIIGVAIV